MKILIAGSGGREHALLWKLGRDHPQASFHVTRPNGGMAGACTPVDIAPDDVEALAGWAAAERMDLAVIGPETPLAAGLADRMRALGVPVFGPSAGAARIESSKAYAKDLMARAGVPTARYEVHERPEGAAACIRAFGAPVVVKASGLAAGKGAVVCDSVDEAEQTAAAMLAGSFGDAGRKVVVEGFMAGEELSVFCLADGEDFELLLASQDHKRVGAGDTGPNTGGMGAYAPVGFADDALLGRVGREVIAPTLRALAEDGHPFSGLLYAGLMIGDEAGGRGARSAAPGDLEPSGARPSIRVVEFNCRFGDPETQAVLPLLTSSLLEPMTSIASGSGLGGCRATFADAAAVTTVLAAEGYPGPSRTGVPVTIPPLPDGAVVFHAGTSLREGRLVASGGRVLAVTAVHERFERAQSVCQAAAELISFSGRHFRRDIGWREARRRGLDG